MTGFGRGKYEKDGRTYTVEIKSVNHKYADVNIRMPYVLSFLEDKIKKHILEKVARGKIDVNIMFNNNSNIFQFTIIMVFNDINSNYYLFCDFKN